MTDAIRPPVGSTVGKPGTPSMSPASQEVNTFHDNSDVDGSVKSQHHTLGYGPTQAAAGDHNHDGASSSAIFTEMTDEYNPSSWDGLSIPDGLKSHLVRTATSSFPFAETVIFTGKPFYTRKNHCYLVLVRFDLLKSSGAFTNYVFRVRAKFIANPALPAVPPPHPGTVTTADEQVEENQSVDKSVNTVWGTQSFWRLYTAPSNGQVAFGLTGSVGTETASVRNVAITAIDLGSERPYWHEGLWYYIHRLNHRLTGMGGSLKILGS